MFDKQLVLDHLQNIVGELEYIVDTTENVEKVDDFATSPNGMMLLRAVCMGLLGVGEEIKKIDKRTGGELLSQYSEIDWRSAIGMRDILAHGYFRINAVMVFNTIKNDVPPLLATIRQIIKDF